MFEIMKKMISDQKATKNKFKKNIRKIRTTQKTGLKNITRDLRKTKSNKQEKWILTNKEIFEEAWEAVEYELVKDIKATDYHL